MIVNRNLFRYLGGEKPSQSDLILPQVEFAYNSINWSTKNIPFETIYDQFISHILASISLPIPSLASVEATEIAKNIQMIPQQILEILRMTNTKYKTEVEKRQRESFSRRRFRDGLLSMTTLSS